MEGAGGHEILLGIRGGLDREVLLGDADALGARLTQPLHGEPVREQLVVGGGQRPETEPPAGCMVGERVAVEGVHAHLVEGDPVAHPVAEPRRHDLHVVGERLGGVAHHPSAAVFASLRQIPVVERGHRTDAPLEQPVDEPVVEREAARFDRSGAIRHDARPRDREAVVVDSGLCEVGEVPSQRW
ncbi:hypothetical protein GCM10025869_17860 [Homoserinibacter gongjuensis]|uniref:Uncharacterized protein n=1 Tax=Homoserinibacter gongjuensis TaxID=1162968 RepID=A0ABQ6JSH8_9MICO|nr:hypothetical protein GCM10025869_17860 [Homoserinibacter gongjuensis]